MIKVNDAFEYMDEEGVKEFHDSILIATDRLFTGYIAHYLNENSSRLEMPSASITHEKIQEALDQLQILLDTHQRYRANEIYVLQQLACIEKGDILPIATDIIVFGSGNIEDIVSEDIANEHPIRDEREGIRYRYYFNHEEGPVREISDSMKIFPCALYIYEPDRDGVWRWHIIGLTRETLQNYWKKSTETEDCIDAILNGSYETPPERITGIIQQSWNRIHQND